MLRVGVGRRVRIVASAGARNAETVVEGTCPIYEVRSYATSHHAPILSLLLAIPRAHVDLPL